METVDITDIASNPQKILDLINSSSKNTMAETLGIVFTAIGEDWLEARMPIDHRTMRIGGYLNGGAIMALTELVGSGLSYIHFSSEEYNVFGIEINGNHIRRAEGGYVTAKARFIHKGKRTQVVSVEISDEFGKLASVCRITNIVVPL